MKKTLQISLIIILSAGFLVSCKKEKGSAPVLPSSKTMVIDFSNFTTLKKSQQDNQEIKGTETSTWQFASSIAVIWNSLITTNISIPLAAYDSVARQHAVSISQNQWEWTCDFTFDGSVYKAVLKGQVSTNSASWKMYLTDNSSGSFADFLWLEGNSQNDGSGGQWIFYQGPQSPVQLFRTDWTKSGDLVTGVKYTYLLNDSKKDSYIDFQIQTNSDLDASYNIHFSDGTFSDADIEWNRITRNGRLKCLDYLHDENWYCWDNNKINMICI